MHDKNGSQISTFYRVKRVYSIEMKLNCIMCRVEDKFSKGPPKIFLLKYGENNMSPSRKKKINM